MYILPLPRMLREVAWLRPKFDVNLGAPKPSFASVSDVAFVTERGGMPEPLRANGESRPYHWWCTRLFCEHVIADLAFRAGAASHFHDVGGYVGRSPRQTQWHGRAEDGVPGVVSRLVLVVKWIE